MSASITDYFSKASNMNGSYPAVATVTAARSVGASTLSCDDLSSWTTDTPVHFSTFKVNADGTIDKTTQTDWKGIVNGNTITDMTRLAGAADSGNTSGERVELNPTIGWLDDLITGVLVSHKQNGAIKDSAVTENTIASGAVSTTKIADQAITSAKLANESVTADKIDFTTLDLGNYSTSEKDTGLTWIDDKKIYKKTVNLGSMPNNAATYYAHGISNLDSVIKVEMRWYDTNDNRWCTYPRVDNSTTFISMNGVDSTNITIRGAGTNWSTRTNKGYATIYYTKSS